MKYMALLMMAFSLISMPAISVGGTGWHEIKQISSRECTSSTLGFEIVLKDDHLNPDEYQNSNKIQIKFN